jgi:hypothetical protein
MKVFAEKMSEDEKSIFLATRKIAEIRGPHPSWERTPGNIRPWRGEGVTLDRVTLKEAHSRSGCGEYIFTIFVDGERKGTYFEGDRCNAGSFKMGHLKIHEGDLYPLELELQKVPDPQ